MCRNTVDDTIDEVIRTARNVVTSPARRTTRSAAIALTTSTQPLTEVTRKSPRRKAGAPLTVASAPSSAVLHGVINTPSTAVHSLVSSSQMVVSAPPASLQNPVSTPSSTVLHNALSTPSAATLHSGVSTPAQTIVSGQSTVVSTPSTVTSTFSTPSTTITSSPLGISSVPPEAVVSPIVSSSGAPPSKSPGVVTTVSSGLSLSTTTTSVTMAVASVTTALQSTSPVASR